MAGAGAAAVAALIPSRTLPDSPAAPAPPARVAPLREELRLLPASAQPDGSPAWNILDPVRNRFFRIGWLEFELLLRWSLGDAAAIAAAVAAETTLPAGSEDVDALVRFLQHNELLQPQSGACGTSGACGAVGTVAPELTRRSTARRGAWLKRVLHNYLFFRLPLIHPRQFLVRAEAMTRWLFSPAFLVLTALAGVVGGLLAARQWDSVLVRLGESFSVHGFFAFVVALLFAKSLHELAHAITATRYGVRVAHMGVAMVVLAPMLYTDTGESWKVTDHHARLRIAAAGMAAEVILAVWATLAWAILPDSQLRAAMFFLATTSWVLTLLINVSPFMRFDGYFILADALDLPNLHERSSALARQRLRRLLFASASPDPEHFPAAKARLLSAFAVLAWVYRLLIFFGIALAVYHFFFKALGIFLFAVEIAWFIVLPIWRELREWPALRKQMPSWRKGFYALLGLFLLGLLFWPWQSAVHAPGWVFPDAQRVIYSPQPARLVAVHVRDGETVSRGQLLFELEAPELDDEALRATIMARAYARQAASLPVLNQRGEAQSAKAMQQARELRQQATAQAQAAERLLLTAPFSGSVRDLAEGLHPGTWVNSRLPLGRVVDASAWRGELLVDEQALARIAPGQPAQLYQTDLASAPLTGKVAAIDPLRVTRLPHPMLDANSGGPIVTHRDGERDVAVSALYRVSIALDPGARPVGGALRHGRIEAEPQSLWQQWLRPLFAVLVRESGF
ncbi:MAG TPA: HlyD family efflux transporter periplasmic adaptor subunit [Accumulibacter sp.]|nr:HlyD family efflux transporter periplasmic adaptor subunit [Accumulibacter sp.]